VIEQRMSMTLTHPLDRNNQNSSLSEPNYMNRPSKKQIPKALVTEKPTSDAANQGTFNIWYYKTPGDRPTTSK
jgi:hypothetical protein